MIKFRPSMKNKQKLTSDPLRGCYVFLSVDPVGFGHKDDELRTSLGECIQVPAANMYRFVLRTYYLLRMDGWAD